MPDDLRTIAARHEQDDVWFKAGHHDPNGYIGMAHKDRGALLALSGASSEPPDIIIIPRAAWDWLMGQAPHGAAGSTFRRMCGL